MAVVETAKQFVLSCGSKDSEMVRPISLAVVETAEQFLFSDSQRQQNGSTYQAGCGRHSLVVRPITVAVVKTAKFYVLSGWLS